MNKEISFKDITLHIIREIRGIKSQNYVNSRLGFSSNQMSRWERGQAKMDWYSFNLFCKVLKIDLQTIFDRFFHYSQDINNITSLIKHIIGNMHLGEVANKTGVSESKLRRWLRDDSVVSLQDFISFLYHLDEIQFLHIISSIIDIKKIPELEQRVHQSEIIIRVFMEYPDISLILLALESKTYIETKDNCTSILSKATGLNEKIVTKLLKLAEDSMIIKKKDQKFFCDIDYPLFNPSSDLEMLGPRKHWITKSIEAMDKSIETKNKDIFKTIIFKVNEEKRVKLTKLYLSFFKDVNEIINNEITTEDEQLCALNIQLFNLNNIND
jgi:transcriptional regulator with XRE-family HTH domain